MLFMRVILRRRGKQRDKLRVEARGFLLTSPYMKRI